MALYRTLSLAILTLALSGGAPASASAAKISMRCDVPLHGVVRCDLSGTGFHPGEHLSITYRVVFTALPRVHGTWPTTVYRRNAQADRHGTFTLPPLRFAVVRLHESYRITASAIGHRRSGRPGGNDADQHRAVAVWCGSAFCVTTTAPGAAVFDLVGSDSQRRLWVAV